MSATATATPQGTPGFDFTVTPTSLQELLEYVLNTRNDHGGVKPMGVPMVWGGFGIGKTDIINQIAKRWKKRVVALHLAQYDPSHLKGVPVRMEDGTVKWFPSSYLPGQHTIRRAKAENHEINPKLPYAEHVIIRVFTEDGREVARWGDHVAFRSLAQDEEGYERLVQARGGWNWNEIGAQVEVVDPQSRVFVNLSNSPVDLYRIVIEDSAVLFLDELSAAPKATQKAALSLLNDKRVGEYDVPDLVPMVAAGNHEGHGAYIEPMSAPVANRMVHINLIADLADFLAHYETLGLDPTISGFLRWKGDVDYLYRYDKAAMKLGKLGTPTPRSWVRLAQQITGCKRNTIVSKLVVGFIGQGVGSEYIAYREMFANLPNVDDILQGKEDVLDTAKLQKEFKIDALGVQHGVALSLANGVKKYYDAHFQDGQPWDKQPSEWRVAVESFCKFTEKNLKPDITMMLSGMLTTGYNIPAGAFRSPAFAEWVKRYIDFQRRIYQGSTRR